MKTIRIPPASSADYLFQVDPGDEADPIIYPVEPEKFRRFHRLDYETEEIERLQASVDKLMADIIAQAVQVKKLESLLQAARAVIKVFVYPVSPMTEQQKAAWLAWLEVEHGQA